MPGGTHMWRLQGRSTVSIGVAFQECDFCKSNVDIVIKWKHPARRTRYYYNVSSRVRWELAELVSVMRPTVWRLENCNMQLIASRTRTGKLLKSTRFQFLKQITTDLSTRGVKGNWRLNLQLSRRQVRGPKAYTKPRNSSFRGTATNQFKK